MCAIPIKWYDWDWSESEGKRPKPTPLPHMRLWLVQAPARSGPEAAVPETETRMRRQTFANTFLSAKRGV